MYQLKFGVLIEYLPQLLNGLKWTFIISILSVIGGSILGMAGALARISKYKVLNWIAGVKEAFPLPMIYCIPRWFAGNISSDAGFGGYPLWAASPSGAPQLAGSPWQQYTLWQYSFTGTVPGIGQGDVDLDRPNPKFAKE